MNTDRDPIDAERAGNAVSAWLTSDDGDGDANNALLMTLVEEGVLTPDEASEALIQDVCERPQVVIEIHDGVTLVIVNEYGAVRTMRG